MGIETLNEDLELNIPMFDDDMDIIAKLDDEPNAVGGLTAAELKAEFDRPGKTIQEYLNKTLIPSLIGTVAEESVRAQNEYVRVTNENQRIANEEAREKAEQAREDKTSGIVAQATEQAKKAEEQAKLAGQVKSIQAEAETVSAESDATAEVVEENGNLLLRMGIPRGKVGPQGPVGPPGPQGIPGNVDFDALTPEQLEMLKGERGPAGDPGVSPNISILPGERDEEDGTVRYGTVIEVTNPDGSKVYAFVPDGRDGGPGPAGADGKTGSAGKDGVTFTPSVSSAGVLSWTNDGGKQNPSSVNIKGPAGPAGKDGGQGKDGERGLAIYRCSHAMYGMTSDTIDFAKFQLPVGYVPKVNDLVVTADNYLYYVYEVNIATDAITLASFYPPVNLNGVEGPAGPAGADGVSPVATIESITGGHRVTITDAGGPKSFEVKDGKGGKDGQDGSAGKDGVTFTPSVSSAGVLSWTNDGGKQNPSSVNIKGPAGPAGEPGDTPYIGANGNWWIGGTDTGVAATGSGSGGASVQADWGENDETKLSHVKGRTHWKEEIGSDDVIVPETTKTFDGYYLTLGGSKLGIVEGITYIVQFNNEEYTVVGQNYKGDMIMGNARLIDEDGEDTEEPFVITWIGGTNYYLTRRKSNPRTLTVSVNSKKVVIWHKMDGGYLPEGVPYTEESVVELLSASGEVDPGVGGFMTQTTIDVAIGDTLIVKYNGTEYECKTVDGRSIDPSSEPGSWGAGNLGLMMGTGDSGEPFVLVGTQGVLMIVPLDGSASVSVVLSKYVEFAYEVPQSCLPDYLPRIENIGGVILPETTVTEADSEGAYFDVTGATVKWESGVYYDITLNGKTYRCVVSPNAVDSENLWIREYVADKTGNLALCPFVARFWELNDTAFFVFGGLNVGDTVKIEGPIIYHKMSRLLMPTGSEPLSIYLGYAPSGDIHSINVTETELEQAISDHRQIILYFSYNGSSDLRAYTFAEYSTNVRFTSTVITSDSVVWCYGIEIESFNGDGTVTVTKYRKSI